MYELRLSSSNENEKQSRTLEELESDLDNVVNHNYIHQETDVDTHYQTTYITIYITIYYHIYYVLYDSRSGTCYTTLPYCESYTIRHIKEADSLSRIFSVVMNLLKTYTNETKSPKSQFFPFMIDHVTLAYMERQKSLQCYKTIQCNQHIYILGAGWDSGGGWGLNPAIVGGERGGRCILRWTVGHLTSIWEATRKVTSKHYLKHLVHSCIQFHHLNVSSTLSLLRIWNPHLIYDFHTMTSSR